MKTKLVSNSRETDPKSSALSGEVFNEEKMLGLIASEIKTWNNWYAHLFYGKDDVIPPKVQRYLMKQLIFQYPSYSTIIIFLKGILQSVKIWLGKQEG